ncbi:alpha-1,2-fucosyltransferase [Hymenobacter volaticus]|uniref:Alpha-1,2-fucosyltransferase n=1 Tax=Hymenobacter volaticus TaxID=2932254 RepID=A0ABY4G9F4_9BACT|nr:alpha-1,2-fucosyltransferase [Hymenobacter volaticus]UOQ67219.1 alpha-1,2-fucosyltransferase [Hymenobacter volaticus]
MGKEVIWCFSMFTLILFVEKIILYSIMNYIQNMSADYIHIHNRSRWWAMLRKMKVQQTLNKLKLTTYIDFNDESRNKEYKRSLIDNTVVFCDGWLFRTHETVQKYRSVYQDIFRPRVDEAQIKEQYLRKSSSEEVIIGLHIRRGDYKEFEDGRCFYADEVYIDKLQQLINQLFVKFKILVFSNDKDLNKPLYHSTWGGRVTFSEKSALVDHYLMSKCDYLMGPPSTFSMCASYIGEVPLYHIQSEKG